MEAEPNKKWRFCAVGNVVKQHCDEQGNTYYGTIALTGGTKIYIYDASWELNPGTISVIGLNRYKRFAWESVPIELIENIRLQRIYDPKILELMHISEWMEGATWRGRTAADKKHLISFIEAMKSFKEEQEQHK